jgi:hypothetical protein
MDITKTPLSEHTRVTSGRRKNRQRLAMLGIGLALVLPVGSASAFVFHDFVHTLQNVITQVWVEGQNAVKWGKDYAEQYKQTQQLLEEYQAKISGVANFLDKSMFMNADFKERSQSDISLIVRNRCPGAESVTSLSDLWKPFVPNMSGDIKKQQSKICAQIVLAESERYNEQVRMVKRIRESSAELERLSGIRKSQGGDATVGDMNKSNNDISRFAARGSMDMDYFQTTMIAYDGLIQSLHTDQRDLAVQAMKGKQTPWGSVVQGATLKAALDIQR